MSKKPAIVMIENAGQPGKLYPVDAVKYAAMRQAYLAVLPKQSPGLTAAEIHARVLPLLPATLFPGGKTAGWWLKGVQLDLEAKGILMREKTKPLRWRLA